MVDKRKAQRSDLDLQHDSLSVIPGEKEDSTEEPALPEDVSHFTEEEQAVAIAQQMKEQARQESLAHFQSEAARLSTLLKGKEQEVATILEGMKAKQTPTKEEIRSMLGLTEESEGTLGMVLEAFNDVRPVVEVDSAQDLFFKVLDQRLKPEAQIRGFDGLFDSGRSWYQTTDAGRARLAEIKAEVSSKFPPPSEEAVPPAAAAAR